MHTKKVVRISKEVPVVYNQRELDNEDESRKKRIKEVSNAFIIDVNFCVIQ